MTINWNSVKSIVIYALGIASVVIGAIPAVDVSTPVHTVLVAIGGVVVAVERYLQGQLVLVEAEAARGESLGR